MALDGGLVIVLLAVLAAVMFGLGMSLTVRDFTRVRENPRVVWVALVLQVVVLPIVALLIAELLGLSPLLAVGLMLLAGSPGGTTANLLSHLFRGDVALNVTLTAVNSVLSIVTLPVVVEIAVRWFDPELAAGVGLQPGKFFQVITLVLAPVLAGMLLRRQRPEFCDRAEPLVRLGSMVALIAVIIGALVSERDNILDYLAQVGVAAVLFCSISLALGYLVPHAAGIGPAQALACTFEVGIHNATLAIAIAIGVLGSTELAIPAAVYSGVMYPLALLAGWFVVRRIAARPQVETGQALKGR